MNSIRLEVNTSQTVMSLIIAPVFQRGIDLHRVGGGGVYFPILQPTTRGRLSVLKLLPILSI